MRNIRPDEYDAVDIGGNIDSPIHVSLFGAKYDLEWLLARVLQLETEWFSRRFHLPPTMFFAAFKEELAEHLTTAVNLLKKCLPVSGRDVSDVASIYRAKQKLHHCFESVVSTYNERLEDLQLASSEDPNVRLGERAGLLSLVFHAAERVMLDCCGVLKCSELAKPVSSVWSGIATTTTGYDLAVWPSLFLLRIPVVTKSSVDVLLGIPHEAGHYLYANFPHHGAKQRLGITLMSASQSLISWLRKDAVISALFQRWKNDEQKRLVAADSLTEIADELYFDLLGGLIGGPAFFYGFYKQNYIPLTPSNPYCLSSSVRLLFGAVICKILGWGEKWTQFLKSFVCKDAAVGLLPTKNTVVSAALNYALYKKLSDIWKDGKEDAMLLRCCIRTTQLVLENNFAPSLLFLPISDPQGDSNYDECFQMAKDIRDGNVVTGKPIKQVLAAIPLVMQSLSEIDLQCDAFFPTGQMFLSIVYSKPSDPEQYKEDVIGLSPSAKDAWS